MSLTNDYELLSIQHSTCFLTTQSGRIERENDPDHSPGPLLRLAGCASGNIFALRSDITDGIAAEASALLSAEPPFDTPGKDPLYLNRYIELLSLDAKTPGVQLGLLYELPKSLKNAGDVTLVGSDSSEGQAMQARLSEHGMPDSLVRLGFLSAADLWLPWCLALHDDQIASIAFAARLSLVGADLGVVTVPEFRGRGYAAAATAGWASSPSLRSHALFYGVNQNNESSRRVVARLGLRLLGATLRIT